MLMREMEGWTGGTSREGISEIGKRESMKKGVHLSELTPMASIMDNLAGVTWLENH